MDVIRDAQEHHKKSRIASLQEGMSVGPSIYLQIKLNKAHTANDASS